MRRLLIYILFFTSGLPATQTFGQIDTLDAGLVRFIEEFVEFNELGEDFDFNTLFEDLALLRQSPINLNEADERSLQNLRLLNDAQINSFLSHRATYGELLDVLELQAIPGFDVSVIKTIMPFVTVKQRAGNITQDIKDRFSAGRSQLFLKWRRTLEKRSGYQATEDDPAAYVGDPNYLYTRYRFSAGRQLSFGFTAEKDAGEPFFSGSNSRRGFDFWSGFAYAENIAGLEAIALGDYTISLGQGLILHNGFGAGKSSLVMNIKRGGDVIRPYSSVNEFLFFRGAAATVSLHRHLEATVFGSSKRIDGGIDTTAFEDRFFTSLVIDGLHRTDNEISRRGAVRQTNAGGALVYRHPSGLKLGINGVYTMLSEPLQRRPQLYNQFQFNGDRLLNLSIDYSYRYRNINLFGESARSDNGGMSHLISMLTTLSRSVDLALSYRNFGRDYHVINGNSFGEGTQPNNEQGLYMGVIIRPRSGWTVSGYADHYRFPWLRFRIDAPSRGQDYLVRVDYAIKRKLNAYIQYRHETRSLNGSFDDIPIDPLVPFKVQRLRFHIAHKINKEVELRNRAEWSWSTTQSDSRGFILYQDILYKPIASSLSLSARYMLFDIDDFNSRIWAYENDILYEFRIPFFQNTGRRFYINARYDLTRHVTAEVRYAQTRLTEADGIILPEDLGFSSGNERIEGNLFREVKAQLRFSF